MDYEELEALRERHAAWRLLRAGNASLALSFLGEFFADGNRGATPAGEVASALDDRLYALNATVAAEGDGVRFPKDPVSYLEDWSAPAAGYLRRSYPPDDDEIHYEVTPAFEKAYSWVTSLGSRAFVGTESRLHTVVDLLRQIVHGTEADPQARLAELQRRRAEIDAEIADVEAGRVEVLDSAGVRDRYQQLAATARDLLADFREVEDNFRQLDRAAREKIAAWDGSKGELLGELIGTRSQISGSDQGRSFQAFYEFLLSAQRQEELGELLSKVSALDIADADARISGVHHDWSEAAERTQRTVRRLSEQLRRFLDDQVWLENRRVLDLVRSIEAAALDVRERPPAVGLEVTVPGIDILLPFERPLYQPPVAVEVDSSVTTATEDVDPTLLFAQTYVDSARLLANVRDEIPPRSSALLADIVAAHPIEQGIAEIVGYLALQDDEVTIEMDLAQETTLVYPDPDDSSVMRRVRLPQVTVRRR